MGHHPYRRRQDRLVRDRRGRADGESANALTHPHEYLRTLRAEAADRYPGRVLIAWSDSWPRDAASYFGTPGNPQCHLVMYASAMPSILLGLKRGSRSPVSALLQQMHTAREDVSWRIYLRNGDDMSLALLNEAQSEEVLTEFAPLARMRGAAGVRRRLAPMLDEDRGRIALCVAMLLSLPGTPVLYYGDEIGTRV
jgi:glycosidase